MTAVVPEKTLIINHIMYLTPEERRGLLKDKKPVQVAGVSVPVWFNAGKSSEPAQEVFVQYTLTNEPQDMVVASLPTGYRINLPQPKVMAEDPEAAGVFGMEGQEKRGPDLRKLGNPEDGGSGWLLFKQFQTLKQKDRVLQILHYIEMRDIEYYWNTVKLKDSVAETEPSAC